MEINMPDVYEAVIRLDLEIRDPAHVRAASSKFAMAWPEKSEFVWSHLYFLAVDDQDCVSQIGDYFVNNLEDASPYPDKSQWDIEKPFSSAVWRIGSGGLHSAHEAVYYSVGSGGPRTGWDLDYDFQHQTYTGVVSVYAEWSIVV